MIPFTALALLALQSQAWDVTQPRGKTRTIDFETTEGTYISVDISPDMQWLVFDLLGHIYRMPVAGGEAQSLTQNSGIAVNYHPRISPDGRSIAFTSDRGGQDNLWVMDADGSNPRPLFLDQNSRAIEPVWMPDGQSVLFTRRMKTPSGFYRTADEIWRISREGGAPTPVVRLGVSGSSVPARAGVWAGADRAQWASPTPDARYVYFHSSLFSGVDRHLRRVELATGHVDNVTPSSAGTLDCCGRPAYPLRLGEVAPEVSPDGRWLAFARKIPGGRTSVRGIPYMGRTALWLRDLTTGDEKVAMDPVTSDMMEDHPSWDHRVFPGYAWAHDGKSIVLTQGGKLRRLWIETGKVETIPFRARVHRVISEMARARVSLAADSISPRWIRWPVSSPDGRTLVFEAVGRLWIRELPAGPIRRLTTDSTDQFELTPAWSSDGSLVYYATWSDEVGGAVWRTAPSGAAQRVSKDPGRWFYLQTDGDGVLANRWVPAFRYDPIGSGWEIQHFDPSGTATPVRAPGPLTVSMAGERTGWRVKGIADPTVVPGPGNRRIAVQMLQDVYLGAPPAAKDSVIDPGELTRLTTEGGYYPHWITGDALEYMSGQRHIVFHLSSGRADSSLISFAIRRDRPAGRVALTGARIITMDKAGVIPSGTVVVEGSHITCIGTCSTAGAARVVNLQGKTIIPGLIDVHAHNLLAEPTGFVAQHRPESARYLAWGVTTIHDPATAMDPSFTIGEMIEAGRITGPRTFATGIALTCSDFDELRDIATYDDAAEHLDREANAGAISIKDYKQCTRTQRQMLAEAARRKGVTITSEGADLMYLIGLIMNGSTGWEHPIQYHPIYRDVAQFFGQAGAHYSAQLILSDYPHGDALEYWMSREDVWSNPKLRAWTPWDKLAARRVFVKKPLEEYIFPILAQGAADIKHAGGYLATGAHGEFDGPGTHWELWSYAQALKPLEALETATTGPAHFLGLESEIGSLAPGKFADLVVLDGNPLLDIHQTASIHWVMKEGRLYDAGTLDELWPRKRPYGIKPWALEGMTRVDTRADTWWDR